MPKVSVILTVYNGLPFLRESIESILQQTLSEFEFLIVDNASTDGSTDYLRSLRDPRLRIHYSPTNIGQTRALNQALREATGMWCARMDADDVAFPERLLEQSDFLAAHPHTAVVGSWIEEIDQAGRHRKTMRYPTDPLMIRCHLLSDGDLTRRCLAHPSVMFVRSHVLAAGGYNEQVAYAQDYDLWTRLSRQYEIHNMGQALLRYRVFPQSTSQKNLSAMMQELDGIVERNIRALAPAFSPTDQQRLLRFLRNRPPLRDDSIEELYGLFDMFFDQAAKTWGIPIQRLLAFREQIKSYYAPHYARRSPGLFMRQLLRMGLTHPQFFVDGKFYKNVAKQLVQR